MLKFSVAKPKEELAELLSTTKWVLKLYFGNYPGLTTTFFITEVLSQLGNLFNAYIFALVIDKAVQLVSSDAKLDITIFLPILAIIVGSTIILEIIRVVNNHSWALIQTLDRLVLVKVLYKQLISLGVANLEDSEISNRAQRFMEEVPRIPMYLNILVGVFGSFVGFVSATVVLLSSVPIIVLAFGAAVVFEWIINQKFIRLLWILNRDSTEERRKASETAQTLSEPRHLKELIITSGYTFLSRKYDEFLTWYKENIAAVRVRWFKWRIFNEILDASVYGLGVLLVLKRLVLKAISVGQLTFELRSLKIFSDSFGIMANSLVRLREMAIRIKDIRELFVNYKPDVDGEYKLPRNNKPLEIKFDNVSFKYPNSTKEVLKKLNLKIKPGEKIAIVGENGAGKTTMVKLICRLYRASGGSVTIDENNLNDLKIKSWYEKLGVLFQDYSQFSHLTLKDNIEIGDYRKPGIISNIQKALFNADAEEFTDNYPLGLDQILSERYKGGIRPSTGQWQKIAIARFFYRDAPVLILDEPTASIDAVAEAQIFDNIYNFIKNKTVIIISHRFATVRNADRIIVLDKGKIVEDGTHEQLLKHDGKYAHAFKLQAKGYQ